MPATFQTWVDLPENAAAKAAVDALLSSLQHPSGRRLMVPLFLHGPAGSGKSHLIAGLVDAATEATPGLVVRVVAARELDIDEESLAERAELEAADLLVVEDVQHLPARSAEALARLLDRGLAQRQAVVLTATTGPGELTRFSSRLTSRLAAGLVVRLAALSPESRRTFLGHSLEARGVSVEPEVVDWVVSHVPGSARQLAGAAQRLEALAGILGNALTLDAVREAFATEDTHGRPTMERIAQRVGTYFRVEPRQMQSQSRSRQVMLPRQVGMYLARRLTRLSLGQIGEYFGGRDHSTVLHACRKVEQALAHDVALSGAVRQLHADLA